MFLTCFSNVVLIAYQNIVWCVGIRGPAAGISLLGSGGGGLDSGGGGGCSSSGGGYDVIGVGSVGILPADVDSSSEDVYVIKSLLLIIYKRDLYLDIYGAHSVVSLKTLPSNKNLMGKNNLGQRTKRVQRTLHI